MSSLTSELRQRPSARPREDEDRVQTNRALLSTKMSIQSELERMMATEGLLNESSRGIVKIKTKYGQAGELLKAAGETLRRIKDRAARDDRMVWLAFGYFLLCVTIVVCRRLGVVYLILTFLKSIKRIMF
jgi:hypothetical protein